MKKIIYYSSSTYNFAGEITRTLALCELYTFGFFSLNYPDQLIQLVRSEPKNQLVVILTVLNHGELDELISTRHMFETVPIVLILPDEDDFTLHKAHQLHPRFITTVNHDYNNVLSVVEKLSNNLH